MIFLSDYFFLMVKFHTNLVGSIQVTIYFVSFITFGNFGCPMYRQLIWLPLRRYFNFTIKRFDVGIQKLGAIHLNSELYIWVRTGNFKNNEHYNKMYPTSNQPAQLYGTAKTHKHEKIDEINVQPLNFRPIIAQPGTCT